MACDQHAIHHSCAVGKAVNKSNLNCYVRSYFPLREDTKAESTLSLDPIPLGCGLGHAWQPPRSMTGSVTLCVVVPNMVTGTRC